MSLLGTPIKIGYLDVANRLVMPPMATEKSAGRRRSDSGNFATITRKNPQAVLLA